MEQNMGWNNAQGMRNKSRKYNQSMCTVLAVQHQLLSMWAFRSSTVLTCILSKQLSVEIHPKKLS